jgi:hypothetical protein
MLKALEGDTSVLARIAEIREELRALPVWFFQQKQ